MIIRDSVDHCLFQAAMWRKYAMDWDKPRWNDRRRWVETVGQVSREECIRRAKAELIVSRFIQKLSGSNNEQP